MIAQITTSERDWHQHGGLYFASDISKVRANVEQLLIAARQNTVEAIVLPELSIPSSCIDVLQSWSSETGGTVIGGSHYHNTARGHISRCPVIVRGEVVFTDKIMPAPAEISPVPNQSLVEGQSLTVFTGTPIGTFGVLICSDYLEPTMRRAVLDNDLDILFVPAFQRDSKKYHTHMSIDCDEAVNGLYVAYSNMFYKNMADGESALFGIMDTLFSDKLKDAGLTNGDPLNKICSIPSSHEYLIADVDLGSKRVTMPRTIYSRPNVKNVACGTTATTSQNKFVQLIAHDDERYRRIESLFVAPREYEDMKVRLERARLLFIVGDPGIGKTYTAAMLLRHYFNKGYAPMWFTGLEREERRVQRLTLEAFEPRRKQVIYFEDPFGRLAFERRESLYSVFGPLVDRLSSIDARVIVTSRKEIFERFLEESLSSSQLSKHVEEMNIIKPSYPEASLNKILQQLADGRCAWFAVPALRSLVEQAIARGVLTTPLAIRGLVYSTQSETRPSILRSAIRRRGEEQTLEMAREIIGCDSSTKILFALVFLLGFRDQAHLIELYEKLVKSVDIVDREISHPSFAQLLRSQLGHRLERSSARRSLVRFSHPAYEEAVGNAGAEDSAMESLMTAVIEDAYQVDFHLSMKAIGRHADSQPKLCAHLYSSLANIVVEKQSLGEMSYLGSRLISIYNIMKEPQLLAAIDQIAKCDTLVKLVHESRKHASVALALRFIYNYDYWIGNDSGYRLVNQFNWEAVFQRLRPHLSLSRLVDIMEWAKQLVPSTAAAFLQTIVPAALARNSVPLQHQHSKRAARALAGTDILEQVEKMSRQGFGTYEGWRQFVAGTAATAPLGSAIVIDDALCRLLIKSRLSILPPGVMDVRGEFEEADIISILTSAGTRIGLAMTEYSAHDIRCIKGHHSSTIAEIIGKYHGPAVVSRHLSVWDVRAMRSL